MLGTLALSGFFTYEVCRKLDPTLPLVCGRGGEGRGGEGKEGCRLCWCDHCPTVPELLCPLCPRCPLDPPSPDQGDLPGGVRSSEDLPHCACACADGSCEQLPAWAAPRPVASAGTHARGGRGGGGRGGLREGEGGVGWGSRGVRGGLWEGEGGVG